MFILINGKPRSGKSYYAVDYMLKHNDKFKTIYANVNGLKMQDNIKPLNFIKLMEIVEECKNIYDLQLANLGENENENIIDEPIIQYLLSIDFISLNPKHDKYLLEKEKRNNQSSFSKFFLNLFKPLYSVSKYKPVLIIMDEAQNQMPSKKEGKTASPNSLISWWISYHGHLFMDVFLLSQNYHKIHPTYIYDIEYFLNAVPASRSIAGNNSKTFKYRHYIATPFNSTNFVSKLTLIKSKKVFDSYESGDKVRSKSVILPFLIFSFLSLIVVISIFNFLLNFMHSTPDVQETEVSANKKEYTSQKYNQKPNIDNFVISRNSVYLKFNCNLTECINIKRNFYIAVDDFNLTINKTDSKILTFKSHSKKFAVITIIASRFFLNLFQGADENENKNEGFNFIGN